MDWHGDHAVRKALSAWARLWVQFASITLGHLVTVFCDTSINPVIKHCSASKPSVLSFWSKFGGGVQGILIVISWAWNSHIPIGVLIIYLGPTTQLIVPLELGSRLPISAWGLSRGLDGTPLHGEGHTRDLWNRNPILFSPINRYPSTDSFIFQSSRQFPIFLVLK